jgi:O-antigen ligase
MRSDTLAPACSTIGKWCTIALGISIPISVAADNILIGMVALCWLGGGNWAEKTKLIRDNPVAIAALTLFGLLSIGVIYPDGTASTLLKYIDLLLIPAFMAFFRDEATRRAGIRAFCIAALASLLVSYAAHTGLLTGSEFLSRDTINPTGFKQSITHNIILAYAAFIFALLAFAEKTTVWRTVFAIAALLAVHNVVFMVFGRTGYVVVGALLFYLALANFRRRALFAVTILIPATFALAYLTSDTFHRRIDAVTSETANWHRGEPSDTSVGLRLEWYANSLKLISEHPLLGTGTGSFPGVYARAVEGTGMVATTNPHNEYLLIMIQIGIAGIVCLLFLFWRQWQFAAKLPDRFYCHLGRGLVITFSIGCLFNSLLIDHTEGLLFAWLTGLIYSATDIHIPVPAAERSA